MRARKEVTEEDEATEAEEEEEGGWITACLNNLIKETRVTEDNVAEGTAEALWMEVEEEGASEGKEEGGGTQQALEALEFLTQEAEPIGTMPVDARNGFNKLSRLAMIWTVQHLWPAGARFAFNLYKHLAQPLLHQQGKLPVTILSREGVTQGDPLSTQDCDWRLPWLVEEKLHPMPISVESKPYPRRPVVSHSPQHCQAAQLVELITGIKERSTTGLSF